MGGGRLGKPPVRFHFDGMNQIRELHGILDEKHRDVVAHQIVIAFLGIEFIGKPAHIARGISRPGLACQTGLSLPDE